MADGRESVWHLYVVHLGDRDSLKTALENAGIGCGLHYPIALHRQKAFAERTRIGGPLDACETSAAQLLSLPMFPQMTDKQVETVATTIRANRPA